MTALHWTEANDRKRMRRRGTDAEARVDPLEAFAARAEARALLWSVGEYELHEAVDKLQAVAVRDGLIDRIGQDAVQRIVADAFWLFREGGDV